MTSEEVNLLIKMIKSFYPSKPILEDKVDLMVWRYEFSNYDKDITLEATRELCNTTKDSFDINIASIKEKVNEILKKRRLKEDNERFQREMAEREQLVDQQKTKERTKRIQEVINQIKNKRTMEV